jgi:hypothetical protein
MNKELVVIGAMILMLVFTTYANNSYAQNSVLNKAGEKVGSTLNELGQNLSNVGSEIGSDILNETENTAKKVGIGAKDVLSNISGEIKQGIIGNSSK